jgi:DNA gyrase subunit A
VKGFEENYVMFATAKGVVKKTPLGAFSNPRSSGIIAIGLDPDDELLGVAQTSGEDQVVLGSREGMAIRFQEAKVRAMGRTARGVRGMDLRGDDRVVDMAVISGGASLLTVCENGYGKRTDIDEYRLTNRGGKGVINIKATARNGRVVALKAVGDEDDLMMITANGIMIRMGLQAIREIGRATQGVRLIRVDEGDRVVAVTRVAREEQEEQGEGGEPVPDEAGPADDRGSGDETAEDGPEVGPDEGAEGDDRE